MPTLVINSNMAHTESQDIAQALHDLALATPDLASHDLATQELALAPAQAKIKAKVKDSWDDSSDEEEEIIATPNAAAPHRTIEDANNDEDNYYADDYDDEYNDDYQEEEEDELADDLDQYDKKMGRYIAF
jgi:hypothetical protein